jgi:CheY-like chemotaxis protein
MSRTSHPLRRLAHPRWSRHGDAGRPSPAYSAALHALPVRPAARALGSILLIDDDAFGRETLGRILEASGYRVSPAASSEEARTRLFEGGRPDLIILDLMRPKRGWRFLQAQQREALAGVPVVLMSGPEAPRPELNTINIIACFEKPVVVPALLAVVRRRLAG